MKNPNGNTRPYRNNHSAWAPLHRIHDWLRSIAKDDEVSIQINSQAAELADELAATIPRLGGGTSPRKTARKTAK